MSNKEPSSFVLSEFAELGKYFLSQGHYHRLIMTDDVSNLGKVRERAMSKVVQGDEKFYFGCALADSIQNRVDTLVRFYKKEVLAIINLSDEEHAKIGIEIIDDEEMKATLVILTSCGMGFYIRRSPSIPREERAKKFAESKKWPSKEQNEDRLNSRGGRQPASTDQLQALAAKHNQRPLPVMRRQGSL